LKKKTPTLQTAIVTIAKMGMAMNDASVSQLGILSFITMYERPVTYIQRVIDPNWQPHLYNAITGEKGLTPPFPTYPSGHGTMGSSAAEILASVFGYNYPMTDRSHEFRTDFAGEPRSYSSFFSMTLENAWSRVPLGVHFRMDSEAATNLGTGIGRKVNSLPWKK
jgi:membrane-associated phospholipid phosphatase